MRPLTTRGPARRYANSWRGERGSLPRRSSAMWLQQQDAAPAPNIQRGVEPRKEPVERMVGEDNVQRLHPVDPFRCLRDAEAVLGAPPVNVVEEHDSTLRDQLGIVAV